MARSFNGSGDKIHADAAAAFSEQSPFSVAFWVNYLSTSTVNLREVYCEFLNTNTSNAFIQLESSNVTANRMLVAIRNSAGGGSQVQTQTTVPVFDGSWHHFAYTQDGSGNWQSYVDGAPNVGGSYTPGATATNILCLGAAVSAKFYPGLLAHVAQWSRKLAADEAAALAAGWSPIVFQPVHYWPLTGQDSPELDLGSSPVNGTLTGTSLAADPTLLAMESVATML